MTKTLKLHAMAIIFAAVFFISLLLSFGGGKYAAADSDVLSKYESQNVLEDLKGMTIDGKAIDLSEYYFDNNKNVKVLSFVEFGYSFNKGNQNDYGLYVYIYNPRGLDFTIRPSLNKISFSYGDREHNTLYPLNYLNRSTKTGYEGLFYKFKVALTDAQRTEILNSLDSSSRTYDVSGIELCGGNDFNATEYEVANVYTYTGYAAGYGSDFDTDESTLACTSKDSLTLSLDVHGAAYRPEGTNGTNNYTQDMLHSVYFSIPNSYINEYGEMTAVHATWLNALTAPLLIVGDRTVYNTVSSYIGKDIGTFTEDLYYSFASCFENPYNSWVSNIAYNFYVMGGTVSTSNPNKLLTQLNYLFLASNGIADVNNADHYTLKGSEILEYIKNYEPGGVITGGNTDSEGGDSFGGGGGSGRSGSELVAGKYYSELFESWDSAPTDINIKADTTYSLTSEKISKTWWEKLRGLHGTVIDSQTFYDIDAIHAVSKSDFGNTPIETCKNLYIDETYYTDFKAFYDKANANDETVYLFRYHQSEYTSEEVTVLHFYKSLFTIDSFEKISTNAYFAQEVVSLDFDIIDVTLTKDDVSTVIACVSSPIDIVPDVTPPVNTTPDEIPWWRKLLAIAGILFILFIVFRFFQWLAGSGKKGK